MAASPATVKAKHQLKQHGAEVYALKYVDGVLYSGGADSMARSWDVRKGKNLKTFKGHSDTVWCLDVHDGILYTGSADKTVMKWDAGKGKAVDKLLGHKKAIFCLAVGADGVAYSGSDDKSVIKHGERVMVYKGHKKTVLSLVARGSSVFSASTDKSVRLWDTSSDSCVRAYVGHSDIVYCLEVADGVLYTGSRDGTARAWNVQSGECTHVFTGHTSRITCLHIADDDLLYTGSADGTVRVWDVHTGECVRVLSGHDNIVLCLAMNPQGTLLFTGSADHTVGIWNARSGELLAQGSSHSHWVLALDCSETAVFSSSRDGSVCIWDVTALEATAAATAVTRSVTTTRIPVYDGTGKSITVRADRDALISVVLDLAKTEFGLAGSWVLAYDSGLGSEQRILSLSDRLTSVSNVMSAGTTARLVIVAHPDSLTSSPRPSPGPSTTAAAATGGSGSGSGSGSDPAVLAELERLRAENAQLRVSGGGGGSGGGSSSGSGGAEAAAALAAAETRVRTAEAKTASVESQLASAKQRVAALESEVEAAAAASAANAKEGEKLLQEQLATLRQTSRAEREKLEAEIARLTQELGTAQGQLAEATQKFAALWAKYDDLKAATKAFEAERQAAEATKAELRDAQSQLAFHKGETTRLTEVYEKERKLRIKYFNEVEDMKGKIRVYCRVRPFTASDGADGGELAVDVLDEATMIVHDKKKDREYAFTHVFGMDSSQEDVFNETTQLIQSALDGYNVCIFAYGQTGSGKTYTMSGEDSAPGITPRAFDQIFDTIASSSGTTEYAVSVYMFEIYNDSLVDLLTDAAPRPKLDVHHDDSGMVYISNIEIMPAGSAAELHSIMDTGIQNRHTGSTNMNEHSSRSHLILSIIIEGTNVETGAVTRGKLSLVDLAGSERFAKTGADKERMKEAQSINRSLSALGNVIAALTDGNGGGHIPYRSNKLTYVLSDSIGGPSKTLMFVNISPSSFNVSETISSLGYGERVKTITNNVGSARQIESREVQRLKAIIKKLRGK